MEAERRQPLEQRIQRRFLPFAAVGLLAPVTAVLPPQPENWTLVWIATWLTLIITASGVLLPWSRLPRWTYLVPPLAYFAVVALLRHASEGSVSGYSSLALLPVVWIALNLGRKEVAIGIAVGASILVVPPALDPESYGDGDLRRAVLWSAVAAVVGFAVEALMRGKRRQAREAAKQARAIAAHGQTMATIAEVARGVTSAGDTRGHICWATLDVSGACVAAIVEPDGTGDLVVTAWAGANPGRTRFRLGAEPSASAIAFTSGERFFVPDAPAEPSLPQDVVRRTGMASALFEPILRNGVPIGVLAVGWSERSPTRTSPQRRRSCCSRRRPRARSSAPTCSHVCRLSQTPTS